MQLDQGFSYGVLRLFQSIPVIGNLRTFQLDRFYMDFFIYEIIPIANICDFQFFNMYEGMFYAIGFIFKDYRGVMENNRAIQGMHAYIFIGM